MLRRYGSDGPRLPEGEGHDRRWLTAACGLGAAALGMSATIMALKFGIEAELMYNQALPHQNELVEISRTAAWLGGLGGLGATGVGLSLVAEAAQRP